MTVASPHPRVRIQICGPVAVELDVTLPQVEDAETAKQIVAAAHEICPYSNATRGNVEVSLTANGHPVD